MLTLTNIDGCEFNNNVKVIINSDINNVTFPNIFSPNGDGNNDIWSVTLSPFQRIKSFNVYDRWGSNVYSFIPTPNENTVSWDGKLNGLQVIPGVYVFTLETLSQKSVTNISYGNITLIR